VPAEAELIGYFDDALAAIRHPVVIAVNPTGRSARMSA
jgi:hypothetical protein